MMSSSVPSADMVDALIAKGRAERSRVLAGLAAAGVAKIVGAAKAVGRWAARRMEIARTARELRDMDSRMLADIGLTRGEIHLVLRGELVRGRPAKLDAANESVAPEHRASSQAA